MPTLEQATAARLAEIRDIARSGVTELTGQARREHGREGAFIGRVGGMKSSYPELERISDGPKAIAAAIERGRGKVFERVFSTVSHEMERHGYMPARARSEGRATIDPHKGRIYCTRCRQAHTKGQHRFHGVGSFHRTHLFSFNPMKVLEAKRVFAELMAKSQRTQLDALERQRVIQASRILRAAKRGKLSPNPQKQIVVKKVGAKWGVFRRDEDGELLLVGYLEYDTREQAQEAAREYSRRPYTRIKNNPRGGVVRIGRALEVRYQRSVGHSPGYYKHEITANAGVFTVPPGWVYLPGRSVIISKTEPKRGRA